MGWYYGNSSKKDVIDELTRDWNRDGSNGRCLHKCIKGSVLWTVWQITTQDGSSSHIGCDLLGSYEGEWGYKPMDEYMGPYYFSCPLAYLDMVPVANEGWREQVRQHHAKSADGKAILRSLKPGNPVVLKASYRPREFTVTSIRPFRGMDKYGRNYRLPVKAIDAEATKAVLG